MACCPCRRPCCRHAAVLEDWLSPLRRCIGEGRLPSAERLIAVSASDKLFYWLFQSDPDRILELQADLPEDARGYRFSAPVLKQREHRLDGLFLPPVDRSDLPALILEAQMAADPQFLRRLYAESARLLEQRPEIDHWRVVVLCPRRDLGFGRPAAVAEFLRERVHWVELMPAAQDPAAPPLLRALALLVQPDDQIPESSASIRARVRGTAQERPLLDVIAAILMTRFNGRSLPELCAMGGITLDDITQSVAYREIYGQGRLEGECEMALRQLRRRCGTLSSAQEDGIRALPLQQLEALCDALLDFQGADDLQAWLSREG